MFNLSEEWKKAYAEYIVEQEEQLSDELDSTMNELMEARAEITKGYEILGQYCQMMEDYHSALLLEPGNGQVYNGNEPKARDNENSTADKQMYKYDSSEVFKTLVALADKTDDKGKQIYQPAFTYTQQKMSDMKFGERIVFFIGQLIKWIRNVVLYFIEKIKNMLKRLIGAPTTVLNPNALKLDLTKSQKIEKVATSIDIGRGSYDVARAWRVKPSDIGGKTDNLSEAQSLASILGIVKPDAGEEIKKEPVIVTLDFSRDIMNLRELMQHFYDLFDNAVGSNNEKLFETDDLEIILKMFKDTIDRVKTGNISTYAVGSMAVEVSAVNKDRVRDNLILTNTNINNLKEAYVQTSNKIVDITRIMNSKELQMISDLGISYQTLSASTYEEIMKIVDTIPGRMKAASKLESNLNKMKKSYEKILDELKKMQINVASISNITYETSYNKRVLDLIQAAQWMNDTVSLRLAGLTLYIKEMKDVQDALTMLANMNSSKKSLVSKIKGLF